jgi:nucleoporin SEH1
MYFHLDLVNNNCQFKSYLDLRILKSKMNPNFDLIEAQHEEFIHDLSFDFFGQRVATCSSDQQIKIFSKNEKGKWTKTASFQAHDATIWKVKWAYPDFGSIIASCSADKSVIIWEEKKITPNKSGPSMLKTEENESVWYLKAKLIESKESIEDIKFAPKHMGLVIAAASADGIIRIYEAPDIMNLQVWRQTGEIVVNNIGINCISWNKNPFDPPMIIVGSKDSTTSFTNKNAMKVQQIDNVGGTTIENSNIVVNPDEKYLSVFVFRDSHWNLLSQLSYDTTGGDKFEHKNAVNDVSWNQLNGRSYHLVASCGKEGVIVWYLRFPKEESGVKILDAKRISSNDVTIWKCSFNLMGTLLAFSGQDNKVRICKGGYDRNWSIVEEFEEDGGDDDDRKNSEMNNDRLFRK